jgi:DNA-binding Lrp family transcriptional regulator
MSAWAAALSKPYEIVEVPEGWNTINELCDKLEVSESTLLRRLRKLIKEGEAEKKTFKIKLEKFHRDVAHYRLL